MGGLVGESGAERSARRKAEEAAKQAAAKTEGAEYANEVRRKKQEKLTKAESKRAKTLAGMESELTGKKISLAGKSRTRSYSYKRPEEEEEGFVG